VKGDGWAAVVLAAGKGTRMKSVTPKVMHRLLGRPILGYVLELLAHLGTVRNVAVTGHGGELVREYVRRFGVIDCTQEEQLGTAHAVLCARDALAGFEGPVLILCGDTPLVLEETLAAFLTDHQGSGRTLSLLTSEFGDPHGYGRVLRGGSGRVVGIVEERDATGPQRTIREVNTGIYAVEAAFLFDALAAVGCDNVQCEFYLTDIVAVAVARGASVGAVCGASEEEARGVNSRQDLSRAEDVLLGRLREDWMARGVTLELARSLYIEPEVELASDVVIEAHVVLKGGTRVASGARVGAFSYLDGAEVEAGMHVPPYSRLVGCRARAGRLDAAGGSRFN